MLRSEAVLPAATGLRRNRLLRISFFFVGLLLFYAPFAFFVQMLAPVFPGTSAANSVADVHTVCLRMPITWLVQPWLWSTMLGNPVYLFAVIVLPLAAVLGGTLFSGWVCPAAASPSTLAASSSTASSTTSTARCRSRPCATASLSASSWRRS